MYDRKLNKAYDMMVKQKKQIEEQTVLSEELSKRAEDARLRNRELEEDLVAARAEKDSVKSCTDKEIARLKEVVAIEVSKAEASMRARQQERLGKLKRYCKDMEEVNRITSLANQSGGIKSYLEDIREVGARVSEARLQSLAADKDKYITELEALGIVEISKVNFEVTPPRDPEPSAERIMADAAASLNQYGSYMSPQDLSAEVLPRDGGTC